MENNEFISWLEKIEIDKLNKDYENNTSIFFKENFLKFREKYLNLSFKNLQKLRFSELRLNDFEKEWLENLAMIRNFFSKEQMIFNKTWKYKVLYFLYGGFIYMKEYFIKKDLDNNNFDFFSNEKDVKWFAFKNGPVTNHYQFLKEDKKIEIAFEKMNDKIRKTLEDFYLVIKEFFSLEFLIQKSHETDPWKNIKLSNEIKYQEINKQEIINYFKKNPPFYMKEIK